MKPRAIHLIATILAILAGLGTAVRAGASGGHEPIVVSHEVTVTNHVCVRGGAKWSPNFWFGNLDDPAPPDDYRPDDSYRLRKWYWRNPTHNLFFYVIGVSDRTFRRSGRYPAEVFNPHGGWNWAVCKYKWLRLPFISLHIKSFGFYLGWRERGNFGGKLTFHDN